nr:major head protein [Microvirus sp.]
MKNIFNSVLVKAPKFNVFNLSHTTRFTCNFSTLIPTLCQEVLPGETWSVSTQGFVRLLPLVTPFMHHVDVKYWFFFVPNRLLWDHWRDFITYGVNGPTDPKLAPQHAKPYCDMTKFNLPDDSHRKLIEDGSLADFLGFPTVPSGYDWNSALSTYGVQKVDIMPFVAYQLIYNEYFINRNVQSNLDDLLNGVRSRDGLLTPSAFSWIFQLRTVNWNLDYYTSCLPFVQRGSAAPIPFDADLSLVDKKGSSRVKDSQGRSIDGSPLVLTSQDGQGVAANSYEKVYTSGGDETSLINDVSSGHGSDGVQIDVTSHTGVKVNSLTATINDLRFATRLQSWMEKSARVGSRYIEQIKAHFGVTSSDARQQRPELLGGGSYPIMVSDVEQTSETSTTPLATLGGKGTAFGVTKGFKKHFEEHGFIMGIMTLSPRATYKNAFPRQFMRFNPMDYYFPEFQHLGEQKVTKREVSPDLSNDGSYNDETFGYQQRFAEYRYIPSTVHGGFKNGEDLSKWVMVRNLGRVALNSDFVRQQVDYNNFADVTYNSDHCLVELYHDIKASRPLDVYATPTL